jgi:hypothetical protein
VSIFHPPPHSLGTSVLRYDRVCALLVLTYVHAAADLESTNYGLFCCSYDAFQLFRVCSIECEMIIQGLCRTGLDVVRECFKVLSK